MRQAARRNRPLDKENYITSNNRSLGSAGEDDAFPTIWITKYLGSIGRKALFFGVEIFVHKDTFLFFDNPSCGNR